MGSLVSGGAMDGLASIAEHPTGHSQGRTAMRLAGVCSTFTGTLAGGRRSATPPLRVSRLAGRSRRLRL